MLLKCECGVLTVHAIYKSPRLIWVHKIRTNLVTYYGKRYGGQIWRIGVNSLYWLKNRGQPTDVIPIVLWNVTEGLEHWWILLDDRSNGKWTRKGLNVPVFITHPSGKEIHVYDIDVDHPCLEKGFGWKGWEDHAKDEATAMGNPLIGSRSSSRDTEWVEWLLHYWRNRAENVMPAKCSGGETRDWISISGGSSSPLETFTVTGKTAKKTTLRQYTAITVTTRFWLRFCELSIV